MKKMTILVFLILAANTILGQQASYSEFKAGILNPKDAKTGWMFTYGTGQTIDESFSWLVEFNLYKKTYDERSKVYNEDLDEYTVTQEIQNNSWLAPIMFKITFDKKIAPASPIIIRGSAGVGYQFMWNTEKNYETGKDQSLFYHGFAYQVSAGAGLQVSSSAIIFGEAFYHGGKVKRDKEDINGFPTWAEKDVSGLGFRVGINFVNFGIF